MHLEDINRLLSVQEAAEALGIAKPTLLQKRLDVPRVRVGRRVLFDPADLLKYIDEHRVSISIPHSPRSLDPSHASLYPTKTQEDAM